MLIADYCLIVYAYYKVDNVRIMCMFDVYCILSPQRMFLVLELCKGGELLALLKSKGHFTEEVTLIKVCMMCVCMHVCIRMHVGVCFVFVCAHVFVIYVVM